MNWQPINTAPQDERIVMASDGSIFGAATRWVYVEPATVGFNSLARYGFGENTERPNPIAGKATTYYLAVGGWSYWSDETEHEQGEYDSRGPKMMTATHWAEMPDRPQS